MSTVKYYEDMIKDILDQAASDKDLTTEDYAELCEEIEVDAQGRAQAARSDLERNGNP